jgi:glutamate racemase
MIGVFDSGIGGLTVVRALRERLPERDIIYLGDTARTPYGNKSADTIIKYSVNNTNFLLRKGARLIVIACNTASSYAFDAMCAHFDVPVFEVIGPGARLAVNRSRRYRIGVIGTRATVASGIYERTIRQLKPAAYVHATACPLLVPLVEEGWVDRPETARIVRKYLHPLKVAQIDTLILGCTHYPVLRSLVQRKIGKRVLLVDSAEAVAEQVQAYFDSIAGTDEKEDRAGCLEVFVTDTAEQFRKTARMILQRDISIQHADL